MEEKIITRTIDGVRLKIKRESSTCPKCKGSGQEIGYPPSECEKCDGLGIYIEEEIIR